MLTKVMVQLQGWILKPLQTTPASTRITYVIQESSRGWMQGFTKKTMARKPLVIASIDKYLQEKAERLYPQNQISRSVSARSSPSNHRRRPSLLDERAASQPLPIRTTSLGLAIILHRFETCEVSLTRLWTSLDYHRYLLQPLTPLDIHRPHSTATIIHLTASTPLPALMHLLMYLRHIRRCPVHLQSIDVEYALRMNPTAIRTRLSSQLVTLPKKTCHQYW